jgi:hypothetical protein
MKAAVALIGAAGLFWSYSKNSCAVRILSRSSVRENQHSDGCRAFEIEPKWRLQALNDEDLKPLWDSLQATIE